MFYIQSQSLLVFTKQVGKNSTLDHYSQNRCQLRVCNLIKLKAGAVCTHPYSVESIGLGLDFQLKLIIHHTPVLSLCQKLFFSYESQDDPLSCSDD